MVSYRLSTFGCKVNQYESQQIAGALEAMGLRADETGTPDLWVVNTCTVTGRAGRRSRAQVRRAAADGRTAVVVAGCDAALDEEAARSMPGVVLVLGQGPDALTRLHDFVRRRLAENGMDKAESRPKQIASPCAGIRHLQSHRRAFLKVQDGCDVFCTYCIVPFVRRQLLCKPVDQAVAEATDLVAAGHREIVLTGVCLGTHKRLCELISKLSAIEGLARLRLSSLSPGDVSDELLDKLARNPVCVPHLHLSLQSGSDAILSKMNRPYRRADYEATVERIRVRLSRPAITTDIIIGFPGETDEDFQATLDLCGRVGFSRIHIFPFSPRRGTAAAKWTRQFVAADAVGRRIAALRRLESDLSIAFRREFLGRTEPVLVEAPGAADRRRGLVRGRTTRYFDVAFPGDASLVGRIVAVLIEDVRENETLGRMICQDDGAVGG